MASKKMRARPAPSVVANPSGVYLKVPLSPELQALVAGHVERGSAIVAMLGELFESVRSVADAFVTERTELERTRKRLSRKR